MLVRTLFTLMPEIERFAAREVPKKQQAKAVQLALRLVRLRAAWEAINKVRTELVEGYDRNDEVGLNAADSAEFSEAWSAALDQEADITVRPLDEMIK